VGIITDGDLARNLHRDLTRTTVDDVMTRSPKTIEPDMFAGSAVALLNQHSISALVVAEEGRPVGILHFHDLLRVGAA
jgi:arabinose-5-phosphate isomerase